MASSMSLLVLVASFLSVVMVVVDGRGLVRGPAAETRIVGGHTIDIKEAPWQVLLLLKNEPQCGGCIISRRWVLTAAHCTIYDETSMLKIRIGTKSYEGGGKLYDVDHVVNHAGYNEIFNNDISVLNTTTDMKLDGVTMKPVKLPALGAKRPAVGKKLRVSGWGMIAKNVYHPLLRAVDVFIQDSRECEYLEGFTEDVKSEQICAFNDEGRDSCYGDSGGPLVLGDLLVGIVSYGDEITFCGVRPSIYVDVATYRGWIKDHTGV